MQVAEHLPRSLETADISSLINTQARSSPLHYSANIAPKVHCALRCVFRDGDATGIDVVALVAHLGDMGGWREASLHFQLKKCPAWGVMFADGNDAASLLSYVAVEDDAYFT